MILVSVRTAAIVAERGAAAPIVQAVQNASIAKIGKIESAKHHAIDV